MIGGAWAWALVAHQSQAPVANANGWRWRFRVFIWDFPFDCVPITGMGFFVIIAPLSVISSSFFHGLFVSALFSYLKDGCIGGTPQVAPLTARAQLRCPHFFAGFGRRYVSL
jgi:hypothetical protein